MSTVYRHWSDLIKPKQLEVEEKTLTSTYGRFFAEPFERGFGQTIGNSMRRILLSSLMGGAIVAVRIKSILHEFSTVPGVTEDVADIILNLKEVRLRLNESEQQTLKIEAKGPGIVYAKDILAPPAVEILNPDHKIATLSRDANHRQGERCDADRRQHDVVDNRDVQPRRPFAKAPHGQHKEREA